MRYRPCVLGVAVILMSLLVPAVARADVMLPVKTMNQLELTGGEWNAYCAATSLAMICNYYGSGKDLRTSVTLFEQKGIVLPGGEVTWKGREANATWLIDAVGGTAKVLHGTKPPQPGYQEIFDRLKAGHPVEAYRDARSGVSTHHYVIVGFKGSTFWINDPWGGLGPIENPYPIDGYFVYEGKSVSQYARHIVQQQGDKKKQKTSWYVSADLRRLWIPDAATFNALRSTGAPKPDVLAADELDALPDQKDYWAAAGSAMTKQRTLRREMYLRSANGKYTFTLRSDGNIELTGPGNALLWDAKVSGIDYLVFQKDGNLAGYKDGVKAEVWSTQTAGKDARRFVVRNDGVAAVLDVNGKELWSTHPSTTIVPRFPICTATGDHGRPAISGSTVVWESRGSVGTGFPSIRGYDLATRREFLIAQPAYGCGNAAISGNTVVWEDLRDGNISHIYGCDLGTRRVFAATKNDFAYTPAISNRIVVWREDPVSGDDNIYGCDLTTGREFPVCTNPGTQFLPAISGETVVWADRRNGDPAIFGSDLATGRQFPISTAVGSDCGRPRISDHTVVWTDYRSDPDGDIYGYDLTTGREFPICTAPGEQDSPAISGDLVVWVDGRSTTWDIYGMDLSTGRQFRVQNASYWGPPSLAISGRTVVWDAALDPGTTEADIYGATLGP